MSESTPEPTPVPGHINDATGLFCSREGQLAPGGRCPDGCDHADHYSNDGHPECADDPRSLAELVARAQARSDTDPTWRTDYTQKD